MAGNALTLLALNAQAANDAQNLKAAYYDLKARATYYAQVYGTAQQLTAAGVAAQADQALITQLVTDLASLCTLLEGGAAPPQANVLFDCNAVIPWAADPIALKAETATVARVVRDYFYRWHGRYSAWHQNAGDVGTLGALGVAQAGDQQAIVAMIVAHGLLIAYINGAAPGAPRNLLAVCNALVGVN